MKSKWVLGFYTIIGLFAVYLAAILPNYNFITLFRSTGDVDVYKRQADANGVAMWISIHTLCAEGGW